MSQNDFDNEIKLVEDLIQIKGEELSQCREKINEITQKAESVPNYKEIIKTQRRDKKTKENKVNSDKKLSNVVFSQLLTLIDNMAEFGLDAQSIKEVIEPKIFYYKLSEDLKNTINDVLDSKIEGEKEKMKILEKEKDEENEIEKDDKNIINTQENNQSENKNKDEVKNETNGKFKK